MDSSRLSTKFHNIAVEISNSEILNREPDEIDQFGKHWRLNKNEELVIDKYGTKIWYKNGKEHREDGPAVENVNGTKAWYLNGELHREDGPAIERADGLKEWYKNNQYRKDGPAIERANGTKEWILNGKPHREDGPAVELANGIKKWYLHGKLHREDGPAIERPGGLTSSWYLNGKRIKTKSTDFNSPDFQKRWKKLVELERVRQVMEN